MCVTWLSCLPPVVGVPREEVGKVAWDKAGGPGGPGCGEYMESDEEMECEDAEPKKVGARGFREGRAGKTLHLLPTL